jgi:hypothetical protein
MLWLPEFQGVAVDQRDIDHPDVEHPDVEHPVVGGCRSWPVTARTAAGR